jgi:asparagine synthetase B (glutamine-hydrolysing)
MFAGAFGDRAIELLELAAERDGATLDRAGPLAILGASGATDDGWRCWLWGRLTNAEELRKRFGATADLEPSALVARAHAQLGPTACDLLRGTFLVVARECERELTLAFRDQLGGRPLVYTSTRGGVLFGEHECDLLDLLPSAPDADRLALAQWAVRGTLPAGRTLYEGVHRLAPAHRLILAANAVSDEPYWLPRYEGTVDDDREAIAEHLRSQAFGAVDRAASGSKRLAVSLSGGLDSACVAAGLAAREGPVDETLALARVFPGHPEVDESKLIQATARHTGLALKQFPFDERSSILAPALAHIARWRLPPASPNLFLWEPVMASAREMGVDVTLDGEGGDELFGLAPYLIADMLAAGRIAAAWSLTSGIGMSRHPDRRTRLRALRVFGLQRLMPIGVQRRRARRRIVRSDGALLEQADALAILERDDRSGWRKLDGPVWWRSLADNLINGGEQLGVSAHLRRASISAGIDQRHPFLYDLDLVRTVLTNPPQMQFDPLRDRALLRDALSGYIPEAVRTQHAKSYFTPLLFTAMASDGRMLADGLARRDAPIRAYVRRGRLEQLLEGRAGANPTVRVRRLWQLGLANTWLRAREQPGYLQELHERTTERPDR